MLAKIIGWSGRNPFVVLLATLFVVVGGLYAVLKTPLDAVSYTHLRAHETTE